MENIELEIENGKGLKCKRALNIYLSLFCFEFWKLYTVLCYI